MYDVSEKNIVQVWREGSRTLMIVFSGIFPVAGTNPFDFLKETEFNADNLIYLHDYCRSGYSKGVSETLNSLDKVIEWCVNTKSSRNLDEVVVVGASSGVLPAFLCAQACGAKRAWGFGPRPIRDGLFPPMAHNGSPFAGWPQVMITLNGKIAQILNRPARDWFAMRYVGWELLETQMRVLSQSGNDAVDPSEVRDYRVYYVPSNKADALVAKRLAECPGVASHEVFLPDSYSGNWNKQPGWDHSVIQVMRLGQGLNAYLNQDKRELGI